MMTDSVKQQEITHHRVLGQHETRQRLLQAAYDTVAHYGYEAASIRHIVERAGFSKGAFFSNFENKESILLELMQKQQQDHLHLLDTVMVHALGDVELALNQYIATLDERREGIMLDIQLQLYAHTNSDFAQLYADLQQHYRVEIEHLLAQTFLKKGKTPPLNMAKLADLFIGLTHGAALQNQSHASLFFQTVFNALIQTARPIE